MKTSEIICATDLEEDSIYTEKVAYELAKKLNLPLKLIHVHRSVSSSGGDLSSASSVIFSLNFWDKLNKQLIAYKARKLSHRIHAMDATSDCVSFEILTSLDPAPAILEYVESSERKAEIIVLGKQRRSYFDEFLLGSVAREIISSSPIPTFLIPNSTDSGVEWQPLQFTIATDLKDTDPNIVHFTSQLAKVFDAKLKLVHVLDDLNYYNILPFISLSPTDADNLDLFFENRESHVQRYLERIAAEIDFPTKDISIRILKGKPTEQILNETNNFNLDILAVAQGDKNSHLAESLARCTRTPLLVIPSQKEN